MTSHTVNRDYLTYQLTPGLVRAARFPMTRIARRGYDRTAVHEFLRGVGEEIGRLREQLARVHAENDRIKRALHQWQSEHAATCRQMPQPDQPEHTGRQYQQHHRRPWPANRA